VRRVGRADRQGRPLASRGRTALLGRISFTLYLIHIPILCSFTAWVVLAVHGWRPAVLLVGGGATMELVLGASWLLAGLVDGFGIRASRDVGRLMTDPF
jgi:peptidoglycan/LPS O-acetylase OafA/YrhL